MEELKPCPFCGEHLVLIDVKLGDLTENMTVATAKCPVCNAQISAKCFFLTLDEAEDEVTKLWNRRAAE